MYAGCRTILALGTAIPNSVYRAVLRLLTKHRSLTVNAVFSLFLSVNL